MDLKLHHFRWIQTNGTNTSDNSNDIDPLKAHITKWIFVLLEKYVENQTSKRKMRNYQKRPKWLKRWTLNRNVQFILFKFQMIKQNIRSHEIDLLWIFQLWIPFNFEKIESLMCHWMDRTANILAHIFFQPKIKNFSLLTYLRSCITVNWSVLGI